ncbi:MAG: hypothetical protein M0P31_17675 [Solirubrobacteraceae bacterium]|nr:hypothetical protein [Solirubrobacteraceae bacterium]
MSGRIDRAWTAWAITLASTCALSLEVLAQTTDDDQWTTDAHHLGDLIGRAFDPKTGSEGNPEAYDFTQVIAWRAHELREASGKHAPAALVWACDALVGASLAADMLQRTILEEPAPDGERPDEPLGTALMAWAQALEAADACNMPLAEDQRMVGELLARTDRTRHAKITRRSSASHRGTGRRRHQR